MSNKELVNNETSERIPDPELLNKFLNIATTVGDKWVDQAEARTIESAVH